MEKSIYSQEYLVFLRLLRAAREVAGVTQAELGQRLGRTQSFVSKCERGERRLDIVELGHFCDALDVDLRQLVEKLHAALGARRRRQ
jgi:transcriptional regulator with XRE-family HTH domain